jgi:hypothetical protein
LGDRLEDPDAHGFLRLVYRDKAQPIDLRVQCATASLRYEKPALASSSVDLSVKAVRADQLSDDELAAIAVAGAKQLPTPGDQPVTIEAYVESNPDDAVS